MERPHIWLFDELRVARDDGGQPLALRPRAGRLLVYLLLHRQRPMSRERVAFALWPDDPEPRALAALRRALSELRSGLASIGEPETWLSVTDTSLRWNPAAACRLDVDDFEGAIREGTPSALHRANALYAGDLLAEWEAEWLSAERDRLRRLQIGGLRSLIAHHRALAEYDVALELANRALIYDPHSEIDHRDLIALLYESGDRAAALATYDRLVTLLAGEFDAEPMAETRALRETILRGQPLPAGPSADPAPFSREASAEALAPIGRDRELERLEALWEAARSRRGGMVMISGAAGIGKSCLVHAAADRVIGRGGRALIGHCYEFEQALPYQGILEMLRADAPLLRHADLPTAHRATLARLAPDLVGVAAPPETGTQGDTIDPRPQLFEALWQAFLALARGKPLLLVIEDVHWAAESTIDWLAYIAPRLAGAAILVVVTYRTGEVDAGHPLTRLKQRLARVADIAVLDLAPLSPQAHGELVTRISGLPPALTGPLSARLFEETAGNPFFLQEIVRGLVEAGQLTVSDGRWQGAFLETPPDAPVPLPESLRELIVTRIDRLEPGSRAFLQAASVAGRVFRFDLVQHAADWADEPALQALDDVLARGFVQPQDGRTAFAFVHHLIQEVIYASMTSPRRVFWHRRLAGTIEVLQPDDAEGLAHHFSRAGDDDRARGYFVEAGERAQRLAALDDAARYYRAALNRWPENDPAGRAELLYKRAHCQWVLGTLDAALASFLESNALFEQLGDRLRAGDTERLIGRIYWEQSDRESSLRHYHRALAILQEEPESVELARTVSAISQMHMLASEFDDAITWGERALVLAERLRAEDVAIHAALNVGASLASGRDVERGVGLMYSSLDRARAAGLPHDAMRARLSLAEQNFSMGRFVEAGDAYAALLDDARQVGSGFFTGIALRGLLQLRWATGRWAEALSLHDELLGWLRSGGRAGLAEVWAGRILGTLYNDLGQPELARQAVERDLPTARAAAELQTTVPHLAELARAHAGLGHDTEVRALIDELLGWFDDGALVVFDGILPALTVCHWLATRPGEPDLNALDTCITWLDRAARRIATPESRTALSEATGLRRLAAGDRAAALTPLTDAVAGWETIGRPFDQARALATLARARRFASREAEALEDRDRALAIFHKLAAQIPDAGLRAAFLDHATAGASPAA